MVNAETLGPAERIIQTALTYTDHMLHNRPGCIVPDLTSVTKVRWSPVITKIEQDKVSVYRLDRQGKKTVPVKIGTREPNTDRILDDHDREVARFRKAGLFPEVAAWLYAQVAQVYQIDNEFAAKWASYAFSQEHRDLKVVLAAFMLVQPRRGDPVMDQGKLAFYDEDYRAVGEAMLLERSKDFNPKLLIRVHALLSLPEVAALNRQLGFTASRRPFYGRWMKTVERYLRYREENPKLLASLVKEGFGAHIRKLARLSGYVPKSPAFFQALRWKQKQAKDGRRRLALHDAIRTSEAASWAGLTEQEICQRIVKEKPSWFRLTSFVPDPPGITRAITAAAIEAGCLSDKDLVILTPTLEELGLLQVEAIRFRHAAALQRANDMRAANIARNVKSKETKEALVNAADKALQKAVEEVAKDIRVYVFVDCSGSMNIGIEAAKRHLTRFLAGFPLDRLHVARFNTTGHEVKIPVASAAGVEQAFRGFKAEGGTDYGAGVHALSGKRPKDGEDVLFIFIGDEEAQPFDDKVRRSGLNPMAFGLVHVGNGGWNCVKNTANNLKIPCFPIDEQTFADPYAIPRTIRALVAATPVGAPAAGYTAPKRESLIDIILKTELLKKPAWAA